ncbi:hypothetical protein TIFTF001_003765 [Ficus carica]|uniref:Uncharacterized protein n=1 Tax=Ficus carica TaxID=3494 RepID=A0AA87ZAE5_FICCA|nr:hypothetical protein TIFTF001_003765 [Ficus carica]
MLAQELNSTCHGGPYSQQHYCGLGLGEVESLIEGDAQGPEKTRGGVYVAEASQFLLHRLLDRAAARLPSWLVGWLSNATVECNVYVIVVSHPIYSETDAWIQNPRLTVGTHWGFDTNLLTLDVSGCKKRDTFCRSNRSRKCYSASNGSSIVYSVGPPRPSAARPGNGARQGRHYLATVGGTTYAST